MGGAGSVIFSARWASRFQSLTEQSIVFSSYASGGSRVILGEVIVLDKWDEHGSTFSSQLVAVGPGYHDLMYEYRSAETVESEPTNSFATLTWSGLNATMPGSDMPLFAEVAWLAVPNGTGITQGLVFEAGYISVGQADLTVDASFAGTGFNSPPLLFAGYFSIDRSKGGHLRLVECNEAGAALAIEFDSCEVTSEGANRVVAWLALPSTDATQGDTRVHQQPTQQSDVAALLDMATELQLPSYLRWRNGSDPCRDRWAGIECRTDDGHAPHVVMVDIHDVDLTGHDLPWDAIGRLSMLEELSLWNCGLGECDDLRTGASKLKADGFLFPAGGPISAAALCGLVGLQVLVLAQVCWL